MSESTVEYGPLAHLIGNWSGSYGMDIAPHPEQPSEDSPYRETWTVAECGDLQNAKDQNLAMVRYHRVVWRKSNDEVFHDELGYFMWDPATSVLAHSISIPRAVCVLAGGTVDASAEGMSTELVAGMNHADWGIVQSPYMRDNARTVTFRESIKVDGDELVYEQHTGLEIYGREFDHIDSNTLQREG